MQTMLLLSSFLTLKPLPDFYDVFAGGEAKERAEAARWSFSVVVVVVVVFCLFEDKCSGWLNGFARLDRRSRCSHCG